MKTVTSCKFLLCPSRPVILPTICMLLKGWRCYMQCNMHMTLLSLRRTTRLGTTKKRQCKTCGAQKMLVSMSSLVVAGALLEFTPLLLNKCLPIGCATNHRSRTPQGGQDPVVAGDLLNLEGCGIRRVRFSEREKGLLL